MTGPKRIDVPTTARLLEALREANAPSWLIERAVRDEFHDYKSESPTPIKDLVEACEHAGLPGLAQRAMGGEFDATREEADAWLKSPEGQAAMRRLQGR